MHFSNELNLNEGLSIQIEILIYFHDYAIIILLGILFLVTYLFYINFNSNFLDLNTVDSHYLETIWTIFPMVVLLFLALPSFFILYIIEETRNPFLSVKVVGHQWYWEYEYCNRQQELRYNSYINQDSALTLHNLDVDLRLVLPVNLNILFLITSTDVIHSWTIPRLGIKVDALPGRLNYLTRACLSRGVFYGQCREICGSNHRFIPIVAEFIPTKFFINYIKTV